MICVYPADCTDFSNNGMGAVSPSSCTVTETLNGEWELTLVHPLDAHDKWRKLTDGNILRVPVPAAMTPQINPQVPPDLQEQYPHRPRHSGSRKHIEHAGHLTAHLSQYAGVHRTGSEQHVLVTGRS